MGSGIETTTALEAAKDFLTVGWMPVPVPRGSKKAILRGWPYLRLTESDLPRYFTIDSNVGLLSGKPSGGLVDVDLDSLQALAVAEAFLPTTCLIHGRPSKPRCHRWYHADPIPKTEPFLAPDGSCLVELRSTGSQAIVPPSVHPFSRSFPGMKLASLP